MALTTDQANRLQRAQQALAASQADTDHTQYPRHLGALEVHLTRLIELVDQLTNA